MGEEISFSAYMQQKQNPEDLVKNIEDTTGGTGGYKKDEKVFSYKLDASNKCVVSLRLMPVTLKGRIPIVHRCKHGWKDEQTNRWYIEYCPTTLKENNTCPSCEDNNKHYDTNSETYKKLGKEQCKAIGSKRARRKEYISCIYVIQDSTNPNNNGKMFVWIYGTKVYNKIMAALKPSEDEIKIQGKKPLPVFDLMNGANFILNLYKSDGQVQYDQCLFSDPSAFLGGDEAKIKEAWSQIIDIGEYTDVANCTKTYDQLRTRLDFVLGRTQTTTSQPQQESSQDTPKEDKKQPDNTPKESEPNTPKAEDTSMDDSEFDSYFEDK